MGEARYTAQRVHETGVWKKVGVEGIFLVCWRALCEEMDNVRNLAFLMFGQLIEPI
jgi:hypothetical protein